MEYTHKEYPCGCKIAADWPEGGRLAYEIEYCPKHKSAPDLYEALKELAGGMSPPDEYLCYLPELVRAREALAKADGK